MIHNKLFVQTVDSKYNNDNEIIFTSHFTGVPALVDNARPPEVTDNAGGQPPLDTDGVHALVELADPLPPTHPAVLRSAGRYHALHHTVSSVPHSWPLTSKLVLVQS